MSDDIYLGRRESNRGCFVLVGVFLLLLALIAYLFIQRGKEPVPQPPEGPAEEVATPSDESAEDAPDVQAPPRKASATDIQLIARANQAKERGQLAEARAACFEVLEFSQNPRSRRTAENLLSDIHIGMVFSKAPMEEKVDYTIRRGDTLGELAKKHGTTVDLIQRSNNIRGSLIRVGDRIRILQGTFSISVSKKRNDMVVYLNERFFKRYAVGTGEHGMTPIGTFKVNDRIAQPTWFRPDGKTIPFGDPENLLGTHWLSLDIRGYGIHGTWEPDTIGKQASAGCVRMLNEEVEELYNLIPLGTKVTITE